MATTTKTRKNTTAAEGTKGRTGGSKASGKRQAPKGAAKSKKKAAPKRSAGRQTAAEYPHSSGRRAAEQLRPHYGRIAGGIVLLVLALCTLVSACHVEAPFLNWFRDILRGLFGFGAWISAPVLALSGLILLVPSRQSRYIGSRVTCSLVLPMLFGTIAHMMLSEGDTLLSLTRIKALWDSGEAMASGGVVSGLLADGFSGFFSKYVAGVLFVSLFAAALLWALQISPADLWRRWRDRSWYDDWDEDDEEDEWGTRVCPPESFHEERRYRQVDIPLDGEPLQSIRQKLAPGSRFTSFFRHKSDQQQTPDQVLTEQEMPAAQQTPKPSASGAAIPTMAPPNVPAPEPITAAEPEEPVRPVPARPTRKQMAGEVAAATEAVTAEIEKHSTNDEEIDYQFPDVSLLHENRGENHIRAGAELRENAKRLADTLLSFNVDATAGEVVHGPSVTRYEFVLGEGVKLSKLTNLADDIALALGASGVRIAPIPDKISVVGIEVPNRQVTPVLIRDVIESREFAAHRSDVAFALGKDIGGRCIVGDIAKLPHVLIAGTTGSGKSVCTNSLIVSLLYKSTPEQVRFIMVDPKMVELAPYNGIPHLLIPVVTDPKKAAGALQWAVFEMMKRYKRFSEHRVKKLEEYNALARQQQAEGVPEGEEKLEPMPSVVVVIDELADLMLVAAKEVEESICRVAQMGRAAGMHLVIATQRPSADVITGLMKANIPSRIAFAVASSLESRIILDTTGAEKLVGKGDMLYAPLGAGKPQRVQGCFISPEEIDRVVEFVNANKTEDGQPQYSQEIMDKIDQFASDNEHGRGKGGPVVGAADGDDRDELFNDAVEVILETGQASVSMLQRRLKLGYSRAARLVDQMEEYGVVGPFEGSKPRQVLISRERWQELQMSGGQVSGSQENARSQPTENE